MNRPKSDNIAWHGAEVSNADRYQILGHQGGCVWLTGLSGSGKSTLARRLERRLLERDRLAYVLDGDNIRHGLNADLGFEAADRQENIRRVGEVARLISDAGVIVVSAFISPFRADRHRVRALFEPGSFLELHVATPLEVCEARDPKGLYAKARAGEIQGFTGIDAPYEPPESPELVVDTSESSLDDNAEEVIVDLTRRGWFLRP